MAFPPTPPAVLFAQENVIYFEFDTTSCVGAKDFQAFYTIPGSGTLNQATEDKTSTKNAPGGGKLLRFSFLTAPSTDYDFFSRAVYSSKVANSAFTRQRSNGLNPPPALATINLYADDSSFSARTVDVAPGGLNIFALFKAVGEDQYESQPVVYTANEAFKIKLDFLTPVTEFQYFLQTRNADGITNGEVVKIKTQAVGCPVGQPVLLQYPFFPVYQQIVGNPARASLTILSSFADVDGDNLECFGSLIDLATGQEILSTINQQNNDTKRSLHTFNDLNFGARYSLSSVVRNPLGIQGSTNSFQATTVINPFNPTTPTPGFTGIVSYTEKIQVSGLSNESFTPGLTIEVSLDREFTPAGIENFAYTRLEMNPSIIVSVDDLPLGQIRFVRSRLFSPARNSIRYSNVYEWDGVGAKKPLQVIDVPEVVDVK
jgi:hypothetical protein